jgi:hypothetical protein
VGKFWVRNNAGTPEIFDHGEAAIMASEFGLRGSGDHTVALQAAINAAISTGRVLQLPAKQINASAPLAVAGPLTIRGTGCGSDLSSSPFGTRIVCSSAFKLFNVDTPYGCEFRDLSIIMPSALPSTAGAVGISLTASGAQNLNSRIVNCRFAYCDIAIETQRAALWDISRNAFYSNNIGIYVRNGFNADSGDSIISNNFMTMATGISGIFGIYQVSSGGLRIAGNKLNGGNYSYVMALEDLTGAPATATSILLVSNNTMEGCDNGVMLFTRAGAVGTYQLISIVGNEIGVGGVAGARNIYIPADANGVWINDLTIAGNVLIGPGSAHEVISIDKVGGFCISGNHFLSRNNGSIKVSTGPNATEGVVGRNSSRGTFAANSIGNTSVVDLDSVLSNRAFFHVTRTTNQGGLVAGNFNKLQFDSETVDTASWYDNVTNFRYTPKVAGYYYFYCDAQILYGTANASTEGVAAAIYKNGAVALQGGPSLVMHAATIDLGTSYAAGMLFMNGSTDYVEFYVYCGGGSGTSSTSGASAAAIASRNYAGGWKISD